MLKFVDSIKSSIQLITSLLTLGVLLAVLIGGLWVYHKVAEFTSKPIVMPTVTLPEVQFPKIKIEAPEIKIPPIKMPDIELPKVDFSGLLGKQEDEVPDGKWYFNIDEAKPSKGKANRPWGGFEK